MLSRKYAVAHNSPEAAKAIAVTVQVMQTMAQESAQSNGGSA